jgi:hypothetical protein
MTGPVAKLKNNAARRDKIEPINLELIAKIRTYYLPEKMTEDDVKFSSIQVAGLP